MVESTRWGGGFDPSWCNVRVSRPDRPLPAVVQSFPNDESVYGIRGLSGNTPAWCLDMYAPEGPQTTDDRPAKPSELTEDLGTESANRVLRGGSWNGTARHSRVANRSQASPGRRTHDLGVRLARDPV